MSKAEFTQGELDDIFSGRSDSFEIPKAQSMQKIPERPSIQNHLKKSQSQMSILKEKLSE